MSVTKSYNKHNNTYYAYDTRYEWDEAQQKRVQIKRCIGKFDPVSGEIIATGKRGRKSTSPDFTRIEIPKKSTDTDYRSDIDNLAVRLREVTANYENLGRELTEITTEMNNLLLRMQSHS